MKDLVVYVLLSKIIMAPHIMAQDKNNAMLCKSFIATIYDSMDKWFIDLKVSSIASFSKLVRLVITNYASNKPLKIIITSSIVHYSKCG